MQEEQHRELPPAAQRSEGATRKQTMSQRCLNCLKYTMCVVNFGCWLCGTFVLGFGIYLMNTVSFSALVPSVLSLSVANILIITGTVVSCVSFLGFLGALRENRCLLISFFILLFILMLVELGTACALLVYEKDIDAFIEKDLKASLSQNNGTQKAEWDFIQEQFKCCGVYNASDWKGKHPNSCCPADAPRNQTWKQGCYTKFKDGFEENFLMTGAAVIVLCIIEVLAMCFSMTLFCHISRSGLGYK